MAAVVVGISGCSNGGKTTLVKRLACKFLGRSATICQDTYFLPPDTDKLPIQPDVNHKNWDTLEALDMERMLQDTKELIRQMTDAAKRSNEDAIVFIDGFLIFNHAATRELCDLKYFVEVPEEVCKSRRLSRTYNPADVPGYVDKYVWPQYLKHRAQLLNVPDIKYLDGTVDITHLTNIVLRDIYDIIGGI